MARTTADLVKAILGDHYGPLRDGTLPDLTPFLASATVLIDRVATCAAAKNRTLTDAELELIERWLAAHLYLQSDRPYASKSTTGAGGGASVTFQGKTGMDLESTHYGQTALNLDSSGCLAAITKRQRAGGFWGGMTPRARRDYLQGQSEL